MRKKQVPAKKSIPENKLISVASTPKPIKEGVSKNYDTLELDDDTIELKVTSYCSIVFPAAMEAEIFEEIGKFLKKNKKN
jgi:hypothetical protein